MEDIQLASERIGCTVDAAASFASTLAESFARTRGPDARMANLLLRKILSVIDRGTAPLVGLSSSGEGAEA